MVAARETTQYPARSVIQDEVSFKSIVPIATGGLPSPTGAIGVPSGVTAVQRIANGCGITRTGAGLYQFTFAPAPNGTVRAWVELQSQTLPTVVDISVVGRDIATGYVNLQCYSASGTKVDPANGDVLGIEYTAFSTGNAAGP